MLRLEDISKSFGGLRAVDGVSLELGDTAVTGLVGPNGSGKTTLFHLVTGFYRRDAGRVFFDGRDITGLKPHLISRRGLVRTFQLSRVLPFLSVRDNLLAAAPRQLGENLWPLFLAPGRVRRQEADSRRRADEILELLTLAPLADQPAGRLSYGQQKLLELGRVLMSRPRLILLDEPAAGVNPTLLRHIVEVIRKLQKQGVRFFLVEHNMPLVAELCQRVIVMESGRVIFQGTPQEAFRDPRVIEAYLGREDHAA